MFIVQQPILCAELQQLAQPSFGNSSRGVDDPQIRERIKEIVFRMVKR